MRKQRRQRKIEIFRLEDRVLFEAAGAAEAVEAVENASNPNPDQQNDISESERQEKEAQSVAKYAGPDGAAIQDPGAPVQDQGAGLTRPDAIQQDPAQKLVEGSGDFSDVPDVTQEHTSELSDFLNADFSVTTDSTLSFSDSLSSDSDTHELIVIDSDAAKDLDLDALSDKTEVLVLDNDSDAMEQLNAYLDSHDGKYDSIRFVTDGDSGADSAPDHLELNGREVSASDLDAVRDHLADGGDLSVQTALDDAAPVYTLTPDGDFELVHADDLHDAVIHPEIDETITVDASANVPVSAFSNPVEEGREELVIINSNIADRDVVLSQLGGRDVLEIDPSQDALSQIQDYLDANPDTRYDAIHILTHGNDQGFYLGSTQVTDAGQMTVFTGHMAENADFMLYGCDLAATERGQALIRDIAEFTGCDVAASANTTGVSGDWILEYNAGVIETANLTISGWRHNLQTLTVNINSSATEETDTADGVVTLNGLAHLTSSVSDYNTFSEIELVYQSDGTYSSDALTFQELSEQGITVSSITLAKNNVTYTIDADAVFNNTQFILESSPASSAVLTVNASLTLNYDTAGVAIVNHGEVQINSVLNIVSTAETGDVTGIHNYGTQPLVYSAGRTFFNLRGTANSSKFSLTADTTGNVTGIVNDTAYADGGNISRQNVKDGDLLQYGDIDGTAVFDEDGNFYFRPADGATDGSDDILIQVNDTISAIPADSQTQYLYDYVYSGNGYIVRPGSNTLFYGGYTSFQVNAENASGTTAISTDAGSSAQIVGTVTLNAGISNEGILTFGGDVNWRPQTTVVTIDTVAGETAVENSGLLTFDSATLRNAKASGGNGNGIQNSGRELVVTDGTANTIAGFGQAVTGSFANVPAGITVETDAGTDPDIPTPSGPPAEMTLNDTAAFESIYATISGNPDKTYEINVADGVDSITLSSGTTSYDFSNIIFTGSDFSIELVNGASLALSTGFDAGNLTGISGKGVITISGNVGLDNASITVTGEDSGITLAEDTVLSVRNITVTDGTFTAADGVTLVQTAVQTQLFALPGETSFITWDGSTTVSITGEQTYTADGTQTNVVSVTGNTTVEFADQAVLTLKGAVNGISIENSALSAEIAQSGGSARITGGESVTNVVRAATTTVGSSSSLAVDNGTLTVSGGTDSAILTDSGAELTLAGKGSISLERDAVSGAVGISNRGTLTVSADVEVVFTGDADGNIPGELVGIDNAGTLEISNAGSVSLRLDSSLSMDNVTGVYGISNSGTVNLAAGSSVSGFGYGYGLYNTASTASITAAADQDQYASVSNFYFGVGAADSAYSTLDTSLLNNINFSDVDYSMLATLQVTADDENADPDQFEFETIDDALEYVTGNSDIAAKIQFNLDNAHYDNWTAASTIDANWTLTSNLVSITGNNFVYNAGGDTHTNTLTEIMIASDAKLTADTYSKVDVNGLTQDSANAILLNNILLSVSAGATLNVGVTGSAADLDSYGWLKFSGDGIQYDYKNPDNFLDGVTQEELSPGIENKGMVSIYGKVEHDTTEADSNVVVSTIRNIGKGELTVTGEDYTQGTETVRLGIVSADDGASGHQVKVIQNTGGTVKVSGGAQVILDGIGASSAAIDNAKDQTVTIGTEGDADGTLIVLNGGSNLAWAVHNNGTLNVYNSFIKASGTGTIGLGNDTEGNAAFTVDVTPDEYLTEDQLASLGSGDSDTVKFANLQLIGGLIYGVSNSDGYAVVNQNRLQMESRHETFSGGSGGIAFNNFPDIVLNGDVLTRSKASSTPEDITVTSLNAVTVVGDIVNSGTAVVGLNDVYLNGNIDNTGSNVYLTGSFRASDFSLQSNGKTYYGGYGDSSKITVTNNSSLGTSGQMYFGTAYDYSPWTLDDKISFNDSQSYRFVNYAGRMRIINFENLSSKEKPVEIVNSGIFEMTAENPYTLYVQSGRNPGISLAEGIEDAGIINSSMNQFKPVYIVDNLMTLTGLNIINANAASAGITNYAGNLIVNGGSVQATYSGIDALVDIYVNSSTNTADYYIQTPTTTLNNLEKIAGRAFSIRNGGDLTLNSGEGSGGTILTDELVGLTYSYSGSYIAMANYSMSVYLNEFYLATENNPNKLYAYFYSGMQTFRKSFTFSSQSASSLTSANVSVTCYSSANPSVGYQIDLSSPDSSWPYKVVIDEKEVNATDWHYGNHVVPTEATLSGVAFRATSGGLYDTAILNCGTLTVTGINSGEDYRFTGFETSINNGATVYWAFDYAVAKPISHMPMYGPEPVSLKRLTVVGDYEIGFDLPVSGILTNSSLTGELTLRGVAADGSDPADPAFTGEYDGGFRIDGQRYVVYTSQKLTLVNFSVEATNSDGINNQGILYIFNGVEQEDGSWQGKSDAAISATGYTGILNGGTLVMINGAVLNSNTGIKIGSSGLALIVNSTFYENSGYAIKSNVTAGTGDWDLVVADTTIVGSGNGILVESGRLDLVNSIVLAVGGLNITLGANATANYHTATDENPYGSNIVGDGADDTAAKLLAVFGTDWKQQYNAKEQIVALKDGSSALSGAIGFGYSIVSNTYTVYYGNNISGDGVIVVTWDKSGNERNSAIGSYTLAGTVPPPSGVPLVNTFQEDSDPGNETWSLREVIEWLQSDSNADQTLTVGFDWVALLAEQTDLSQWVFNLTEGSLTFAGGNDAGIASISINGLYSAGNTMITVNGDALTSSVFNISGMTVQLSNMTIDGSGTEAAAVDVDGAAFHLEDAADTLLMLGGGVTIQNSYTSGNGGAVYVGQQATLTVSNAISNASNTISTNKAQAGGAVYNEGTVTVAASTFSSNSATENGGAIYNGGTLTVTSSAFSSNSATNDGGAIYNGGTLTVTSSAFSSNSATENGGAVYVANGNVNISGSTFFFNLAEKEGEGEGAALYVDGGRLDAVNSTFARNGFTDADADTPYNSAFAISASDAAALYLADVTVADNGSGISLGGTDGEKVILNSIVLNTKGTNLRGTFSNEAYESYETNYIGIERTAVFGDNQLVTDVDADDFGTISLNADNADNPALAGGALIARDGDTYYYSLDKNSWLTVDGTADALQTTAVTYTTDQIGASRIMGAEISKGAVVVMTDAVIVVNTSADTIDDVDTVTSLREAIIAANEYVIANPGTKATIVFDASSSLLVNGTVTLTAALPDLNGSITINGFDATWNPGNITITVNAAGAKGDDGSALTVSPLTITGGSVTVANVTFVGADLHLAGETARGGMFSVTGGTTVFDNVIMKNGTAAMGGALYIAAGATVQLNNSTVTGSTAAYQTADGTRTGGRGGGIYNAGTLTVSASAFSSNKAGGTAQSAEAGTGEGGAIYNAAGGNLTIAAGEYTETADADGNVIYTLDETTSTSIVSNTSDLSGGAIYNAGTATVYLEGNTISGNSAVNGGAFYNADSLTVTDNDSGIHRPTPKILASNNATNGGAIYNEMGILNVSYVALSSNSATAGGSAIHIAGGSGNLANVTIAENSGGSAAVAVDAGSLTLNFVTIAMNKSAGLVIADGAGVIMNSTLVAVNGADGASDVTGTYTGNGNLVSDGAYSQTLIFGSNTFNQAGDGTIHLNDTLQNPAAFGGVYDKTYSVDQIGNERYQDGTATSVGAWAFTEKPTKGLPNVVTTAADVVDETDGLTSLREAIEYVNLNGGTVYFDYAAIMENSGTFVITLDAALGSLAITNSVKIDGVSYYIADPNDSSKDINYRAGYEHVTITVDGSKLSASTFTITDASVTVSTLAVVGGSAENGGAFNIASASGEDTSTLLNLTVSGGKASGNGGNIYVGGGNLTLKGTTVSLGKATGSGGGIYFAGENLTLTNSTAYDGRLYLSYTDADNNSYIEGRNSYVQSNTAGTDGGGIYFAGSTLDLNGVTSITRTTRENGIVSTSELTDDPDAGSYVTTGIYQNVSSGDGGGIYVAEKTDGSLSILLNNATVVGNSADKGDGGAFHVTPNANFSFVSSGIDTISGNKAVNGGAFYFASELSSNATLQLPSVISGNSASGNGGAIYAVGNLQWNKAGVTFESNSAEENGGALYVEGTLTMNGGTFENNSSSGNGGAVYVGGGAAIQSVTATGNSAMNGGAFYFASGSVSLAPSSGNSVVLEKNSAMNGGALYIASDVALTVGSGSVAMNNNSAVFNSSSRTGGNGGAIYNAGTLTMDGGGQWILDEETMTYRLNGGLTASGNLALGNGNDIAGDGGFLYNAGTATLSNFTVSGNLANGSGGAIYSAGDALTLNGMLLSGNQATNGNGGAVAVTAGNLTVNSSEFSGNTAIDWDPDSKYLVDKGGAIYFSGSGNLTIQGELAIPGLGTYGKFDTRFISNTATRGGALYLETTGGTVDISNVSVFDNIGRDSGADGSSDNTVAYVSQGAGFWIGGSNSGRLTLENVTFAYNQQMGEGHTWGGGLYVEGVDLNLVNTTFYANSANHGGALFVNDTDVSIVNTTIAYNEASNVLNSGAGGGGIFVTGLDASISMLNSIVAGNVNTGADSASEYYQSDIVLKHPLDITVRYSLLGGVWQSADETQYQAVDTTASNWGDTNYYGVDAADLFEFSKDGSTGVYFGYYLDAARLYKNVVLDPVYGTTPTLMIRPDSLAAYAGVYAAIDRTTGDLYYNTLNYETALNSDSASYDKWMQVAADGDVEATVEESNIITVGQNGWTRTDQLSFNVYNVGAHALNVLDADFYSSEYEYNVSQTYHVDPTITTTNDVFNPYDGLISLSEANYLAGKTLTRTFLSTNPDVQNLTETFEFSSNVVYNTDPHYYESTLNALRESDAINWYPYAYYLPTAMVFQGPHDPSHSIVVTTTADVVNDYDGVTSLREALALAEQYAAEGKNNTITFTVDFVVLNDLLDTIDFSVLIDGGTGGVVVDGTGITGGDASDYIFTTEGEGNSIRFNNITIDAGRENAKLQDGNYLGGIHNEGAQVTMNGGGVQNGYSVNGGGILNAAGVLILNNAAFSGNHAYNDGGAISNSGTLTVNGGSFTSNMARNAKGGAISNSGTLSVSNASFRDNQAAQKGGAIYTDTPITVNNSVFENNRTPGDGGAIYGSDVTVNGGSFTGNRADNGSGGAISGSSLSVSNAAFTGNTAAHGGAISGSDVTVNGGTFDRNTAFGNGGAILATGSLSVNSNFTGNEASTLGGAIAAFGSDTTISGTFDGNTTYNENSAGGAVYLDQGGTLANITLTNNTAKDGAAVYSAGGALIMNSATVTGSHATAGSVVTSRGDKTVIRNSSLNNNTASGSVVNAPKGELFLISTTVAENSVTEADVFGEDVSIVNSTIAEAGRDEVLVRASDDVQIANSIVVGAEAGTTVIEADGDIDGAYSVLGQVASGGTFNNEYGTVTMDQSYADVFGNNTVNGNGLISLPSGSPAMAGVWTAVDTDSDSEAYGSVYYTTRPEGMWTQGYNPNRMSWNLLGAGAIGGRGNVSPGATVSAGNAGGTYPSIGSSWNLAWTPDFGHGLNSDFIKPSENGVAHSIYDIYNAVSDRLYANPGYLLNFRNEVSGASRLGYDFMHEFDDRYRTMGEFSVTIGRFDLGFVPSGENHITVNVKGDVSDDFTRYTTTPYLSDGTPLIPEELKPMNSETETPAAEGTTALPEGLEEKVMAYLGRAEIFKDDFDKALDRLLALNV